MLVPSAESSGFGNDPCIQEKSRIPSIGSVIWDLSVIVAGLSGLGGGGGGGEVSWVRCSVD